MAEPHHRLRRLSLVDLGAAAAVGLAAAGIIWSPKLSGTVARATGAMQTVEVTIDVKHVPAAEPQALVDQMQKEGRTSLVIRNQPHGSVKVNSVRLLTRQVALMNPQGTVTVVPDPNNGDFSTFDARITIEGEGQLRGGGVVLGNQALKLGSAVELEGPLYRVKGTVSGIAVEGN